MRAQTPAPILVATALILFLPGSVRAGIQCIKGGEIGCKTCQYQPHLNPPAWRCVEVNYDAYCDCQNHGSTACSFDPEDFCDYVGSSQCQDPPFCPKGAQLAPVSDTARVPPHKSALAVDKGAREVIQSSRDKKSKPAGDKSDKK